MDYPRQLQVPENFQEFIDLLRGATEELEALLEAGDVENATHSLANINHASGMAAMAFMQLCDKRAKFRSRLN